MASEQSPEPPPLSLGETLLLVVMVLVTVGYFGAAFLSECCPSVLRSALGW